MMTISVGRIIRNAPCIEGVRRALKAIKPGIYVYEDTLAEDLIANGIRMTQRIKIIDIWKTCRLSDILWVIKVNEKLAEKVILNLYHKAAKKGCRLLDYKPSRVLKSIREKVCLPDTPAALREIFTDKYDGVCFVGDVTLVMESDGSDSELVPPHLQPFISVRYSHDVLVYQEIYDVLTEEGDYAK